MKSYIEPLNAADALDVLDLYGIDTPGAFFSSEHEGCVEVELSGHTALLETPESVAMLFGHDAATALCQHSNFRRDAAEIMSRALDLDDFLYNVYSGTAFIPDKAPDGEFFGFHVTHTPLSAILEDDIDPLSPDVCDYGLDPISETTEDAAVGYFDPAGAVDDEKFLTSADWALCDIESSVLTAFGTGCSPELAGWTLGQRRERRQDVRLARGRYSHGPGARQPRARRRGRQGGHEGNNPRGGRRGGNRL